jgi:hypothetical protein
MGQSSPVQLVKGRPLSRAASAVEKMDLTARDIVDKGEEVAAQPAVAGLRHRQEAIDGDRGIGGVAPGSQHVDSG